MLVAMSRMLQRTLRFLTVWRSHQQMCLMSSLSSAVSITLSLVVLQRKELFAYSAHAARCFCTGGGLTGADTRGSDLSVANGRHVFAIRG